MEAVAPSPAGIWSQHRAIELAGVVALAALMAATGPFGTYALAPLWELLGYWFAAVLIGYAVYRPAISAVDLHLGGGRGRAPVQVRLVAVLVSNLPVALLVWLASYRHTPRLWPTPADLLLFYPSVLVIGLALLAVIVIAERVASFRRPTQPGVTAGSLIAQAECRFLQRLPVTLGRDLIALEMEDHYVRAYTARGSALLLMRMRDAVAELDGFPGAQVHRSWWVAAGVVRKISGPARATRLELINGLTVPVARSRTDQIEALRAS